MDTETIVPGRWTAAVLLLVPAFLGFQVVYFSTFGAVVMLGAAFASALATGYARRDAIGVAFGCGTLVAAGGTLESSHAEAAVVAYACACAVAIRPGNRVALGARVAALAALLGLSRYLHAPGDVHAWGRVPGWWLLLLVPPVVAMLDAAAARDGGSSEPPAERSPTAGARLALASGASLLVLALPWLLQLDLGYLGAAVVGLGLAAALTAAVGAVRNVRVEPARSLGTLALTVVPLLVLGAIVLLLVALAFGANLEIGG